MLTLIGALPRKEKILVEAPAETQDASYQGLHPHPLLPRSGVLNMAVMAPQRPKIPQLRVGSPSLRNGPEDSCSEESAL